MNKREKDYFCGSSKVKKENMVSDIHDGSKFMEQGAF